MRGYRFETTTRSKYYLTAGLFNVLMHFVQAVTFAPLKSVADCKFGFCFLLVVGLYLVALSLTRVHTIFPVFPQSSQTLDIFFLLTKPLYAISSKLARLGGRAKILSIKSKIYARDYCLGVLNNSFNPFGCNARNRAWRDG